MKLGEIVSLPVRLLVRSPLGFLFGNTTLLTIRHGSHERLSITKFKKSMESRSSLRLGADEDEDTVLGGGTHVLVDRMLEARYARERHRVLGGADAASLGSYAAT